MELEYIDELIELSQYTAVNLYMNNLSEVSNLLGDIQQKVTNIYRELIIDTAKYKAVGIDIPGQVLLEQLKNLMSACEFGDILGIADTLMYEITQGLLFYKEVKGMV